MGPITTRVFSQFVESGNILTALGVIESEVNAFLATLDANNVADIRYDVKAISKYGERCLVTGIVLYVG